MRTIIITLAVALGLAAPACAEAKQNPKPHPIVTAVTSVERPGPDNTGPRIPEDLLNPVTVDQAMTQLCTTGHIEGVRIGGGLKLSDDSCAKKTGAAKHATGAWAGWTITDSVIQAGGLYGVQAFISLKAFTGTPALRPRFEYVEIRGAVVLAPSAETSAVFYGKNVVFDHCDLWGGVDIAKVYEGVTIQYSWLHGLHHPDGAHADVVQIREARNDPAKGQTTLLLENYMDAAITFPANGGQGNGVLQTGSMTGPVVAVRWDSNWLYGGGYTLRTGTTGLDYVFSANRLGRTYVFGPLTGANYGDGTNVWDDTGEVLF